jgi:hypothetical protein
MARGWESKSVEEQQAERSQPDSRGPRLNPQQADRRRQLEALILSRKRIEHDLESASNPVHREMLQRGLSDLNEKIARIPEATQTG